MKSIHLRGLNVISNLRKEGWSDGTNAIIFNLFIIAVFAYALIEARNFPPRAFAYPFFTGLVGLIASLISLFIQVNSQSSRPKQDDKTTSSLGQADLSADLSIPTRQVFLKAGRFIVWFLFYYLITALVGLILSTAIFFILFFQIEGKIRWWLNALITLVMIYFFFGIAASVFRVIWPIGVFGILPEPLPIPWIDL